MSLAELIRRYPQGIAIIAAVVLIGSLIVIFRPRSRDVPMAYFMDVGSGELFMHDGAATPPITAPSGGDGVLAHVYACGACTPDNQHVGYLVKYVGLATDVANMRVAAPASPDQWLSVQVPEGVAVIESVNAMRSACADGFTECMP